MKRIASLILVATLVLGVTAGCGQQSPPPASSESASPATSASTSGEEATPEPVKELEPITFTMYSTDPNSNYENFESPVAQIIKEKTGVTLDIEYLVGDNRQKVALMAASGDYPDLVFAKGEQNIMVDAGSFLDLTDMIDEYGPNIKSLYGDYLKRLRYSLDDKSIYWLGSFGVDDLKFEPGAGFQLQHAVVKDLGFPEIHTVRDYENAVRTYMEKYPTIDGQPTIGVSLLADGWRILITVTNPATFATGNNGDDGEWYIDQNTFKAIKHNRRPEQKEYYRWLNHMYNSGLLDPESFTQKYDQYLSKISSGRVLGLIDATWQYAEAQTKLRQDGKEDRMYGIYPAVLEEGMEFKDFMTGGYSAGWGLAISDNCSDPVRAIQFLDWMASDEAQILNHWGIEGEHYSIIDGKRVISDEEWVKRNTDPEYGKKTGVGVYTYPFPQRGRGQMDATGNYYQPVTPEQVMVNYTDTEREVLAGYGKQLWADFYRTDYPAKAYGLAWQINIPQDSDGAVIDQRVSDINWQRIPEAIMANPNQFDAIYDAYQMELINAGVEKLEEEFTELLSKRVQLWND